MWFLQKELKIPVAAKMSNQYVLKETMAQKQ